MSDLLGCCILLKLRHETSQDPKLSAANFDNIADDGTFKLEDRSCGGIGRWESGDAPDLQGTALKPELVLQFPEWDFFNSSCGLHCTFL